MKKRFNTTNTGFVAKSLLWSLLLYCCTLCMCHWQEISGILGSKDNQPVVQTSSFKDIKAVNISLDSLHKRIHIADVLLRHLGVYINR